MRQYGRGSIQEARGVQLLVLIQRPPTEQEFGGPRGKRAELADNRKDGPQIRDTELLKRHGRQGALAA